MRERQKGEQEDPVDRTPRADKERKRCCHDMRYLYRNVLDVHKLGTGVIHDFLFDFLRADEPGVATYSPLPNYMPEKGKDGTFRERWIWWPILGGVPTVQDGPLGDITKQFEAQNWAGLIIRIVGDYKNLCCMLPRSHLKSELANKLLTIQNILRDPASRTLLYTETRPLAVQKISELKWWFTSNAFQRLWGDLGPPKKGTGAWNEDQIQVNTEARRGGGPTVMGIGIDAEITGFHFDYVVLDDVVGRQNITTKEQIDKVIQGIQHLTPIREPGSKLINIGTMWSDDDPHGQFMRPGGVFYDDTALIVATCRDAEGKPLFPEKFSSRDLDKAQKAFSNPADFYCQYWNQFRASATALFKPEWIRYYDKHEGATINPRELIGKEKLDVYVTIDPANSKVKASDLTAAVVIGQAKDGVYKYILDILAERLSPDKLPERLAEFIMDWQLEAAKARVGFRVGIENYSFQEFVRVALDNKIRQRGGSAWIEPLEHKLNTKDDRITRLCSPFASGCYLFPTRIYQLDQEHKQYDAMEVFLDQYKKFRLGVTRRKDDILDALAYAEVMVRPMDSTAAPPQEPNIHLNDDQRRDVFDRKDALREINERGQFTFRRDQSYRTLPIRGLRRRYA